MPQSPLEVLYAVLLTLVFGWWIGRWKWIKDIGLSTWQLRAYFVLKVIVGLGLSILYEKYYNNRATTDAFRFFDDAMIIGRQFWSAPDVYFKILLGLDLQNSQVLSVIDQLNNWYKEHQHGVFNDNQTVIRFNALLVPLSLGYYQVHNVVVNLLSFAGIMAMLRAFNRIRKLNKFQMALILLFPQVLFWTSGVLKEAILIAVLGWFLGLLFQLFFDGFSKFRFLLLILTVFLLFQIKSYVFFCLIPGITVLFVAKVLPQFKRWIFALLLFGLQISAVVLADMATGNMRAQAIYQKQHDFINAAKLSHSGSFFESFVLEPNWNSILLSTPQAFFNTLARPFIWNCQNPLMYFASLENVFLIFLIVWAIVYRKKYHSPMAHYHVFFLGSTILLFVLVGLITPVSGALVRYKVPFIPFIVFWIWLVLDDKRMGKLGLSNI